MVRKVGNGHFTSFWRDKWVGNAPFVMQSLAFSLFLLKKRLWWWTFGPWQKVWGDGRLFGGDNLSIEKSIYLMSCCVLFKGLEGEWGVDAWWWILDEDGVFLARSSYKVLKEGLLLDGESNRLEEGFFWIPLGFVWKFGGEGKEMREILHIFWKSIVFTEL